MSEALLHRCMGGEPAVAQLAGTLRELVGDRGRASAVVRLDKGVYRIMLATPKGALSLVAKRLAPDVACRNQLALERWLPAAGLEHVAPALLGVAADPRGLSVWHLYEDLGAATLADAAATSATFEAAVRVVAAIHARFARAHVLHECRAWGEDHGRAFYDSNIREATAALRMVVADAENGARDAPAARRLLARLERLDYEREDRARALAEFGGPETLLHGDLWPKNAVVLSTVETQRVCLIDWDHLGPGSFSYDLSTLVIRTPARHRAEVVDLYRRAAAQHGMRLPDDADLRALFVSAEYARLANITIYPALVAAARRSGWAFQRLAEIDEWLASVPARCSG